MDASRQAGSEIRVFSGGAPKEVLRALTPSFEAASGHRVAMTFLIVGDIMERLKAGNPADLVMLPSGLLDDLAKVVPMRAEGRGPLASVGIGVIVRAGAAHPPLASEADVVTMLHGANAIALADPRTPSGRYLATMLESLGLADALRDRLILQGAIHGGGELVASGRADLGLYLVSEVQHIAGVEVAGLLPPPLQRPIVYATAIPVASPAPDAALSLIGFLTAREHAAQWTSGGFDIATPH